MKQLLNGFQCEKCNSIFNVEEKALNCEKRTIETPLLKIGEMFIDDSYEVECEMKVCKISFDEHQINYLIEWKNPNGNGDWEEIYTIFGNEMLSNYKNIK